MIATYIGDLLYTNYPLQRPLGSYACSDQKRGKRAKSTNIYTYNFFQKPMHFSGKRRRQFHQLSKETPQKPIFFGHTIAACRLGSKWKPHTNHPKDPKFLARRHLSHLSNPIERPQGTITWCQAWYFLLAPIYQC